jgi:hypothetical protein
VEAYAGKYGWQVIILGNAIVGDGAPTAGPPPYDVYELVSITAFGFATEERHILTRWRLE